MDIEGCVGPQNSLLWPFWALFSFLWHTMTLPYTKNYSNLLPGLCLNYSLIDTDPPDWSHQIHLWSKGPFLAVLEPMGPGPMAPSMAHLTHKTVPMHHHGCAGTCSTLIPHCSTRLEPPDQHMAKKERFWPLWTLCVPFDAPGWPPMTHKTVARHHPRCSLTCSTLIPNCFIRL